MNFWKSISEVGVEHAADLSQRKHIILCNRVSVIVFLGAVLIILVAISYFGIITSILLSITITLLLLTPLLFNHFGLCTVSRLWMVFMLTVPSTVISVLDKMDHPYQIEDFEYYQYRVIQITSAIYPFLLFSLRERKTFIPAFLIALTNLALQDPIHNFFGVGYYQAGFMAESYSWVNYISVFAFFILGGSTYFLKISFEKTDAENQQLIDRLTQQQKHLEQVNELVQSQREELSKENRELNRELVEKNNQLSVTNQELIKHNNELQQFSYTVSHNLRGPVASLKGIVGLIDKAQLGPENIELFRHLEQSIAALESTIRDLNHIIDVRNEVTRFRQRLVLAEELNHVKMLLQRDVEQHGVVMDFQFNPSFSVYSVKSMLSSILYNLVSNAIKYRSPDRPLKIIIRAFSNEHEVNLEIEDNGLGMDLDKYREKMFGLYKRFHSHTEGRGLGLFLVKLQVDTLGGTIDVKSVEGQGTCFSLSLPTPQDYNHQVLLDTDAAHLFFDASINCLAVNWKRLVSADEFRFFLEKTLEFMQVHKTANWISNLAQAAHRDEAELNHIRQARNKDLIKAGLQRAAVVMPKASYSESEYRERTQVIRQATALDLEFFDTMEEARNWITGEHHKTPKAVSTEDPNS